MTATNAAGAEVRSIELTDLPNHRGHVLGTSPWRPIDQSRINSFASATDDHQWIHVDPVRAADGPFGATVAHGFLTLSMLPTLLWASFRVSGAAMEVNYGLDRVRFPAPVPAGASIRGRTVLSDVVIGPSGHMLHLNVTVECDRSDRPACVADLLCLYVPQLSIQPYSTSTHDPLRQRNRAC